MATTSTDPREIEADLERERAALANTLDTLSDRVSVDNLAKEALGMLKSHAGTATHTIDHAVRANPLAVALIGAGIAWMFLGPKVTGGSSKSSSQSSGYGQPSTYDASGTARVSGPYYGGSTQRDDAAWAASGSGRTDYGRVGYVASDNDDDHAWSREATGLRARASQALHRIEQEAKSYYESLKNALPGSGSSSLSPRDFEAERQSVLSSFTSDLRSRFAMGLDSLPEGSRQQVIAARERAYQAMLQAERTGRDVIRDPGRAMEEHPLVAGAVAFALGAAVAAMLPGTDAENRAFGAERDRLMNEASRLLREERGRMAQIAGSLGQEVKAVAQETVEAVTDTVTNKVQDAAGRVTERASEEFQALHGGSGPSSSPGSSMGGTGTAGSGSMGSGMSGSGRVGPGDPVIG